MDDQKSLLSLLRQPIYLFIAIGFSFLIFDMQYLMMARLPGYENEMCLMGAGLEFSNIFFAIAVSTLGGMIASGFIFMFQKRKASLQTFSFSSMGIILSSLTLFCAACTLPVISFFGLAIGLQFFTSYNVWFKIISLLLIGYAFYDIDKQIRGSCKRCFD